MVFKINDFLVKDEKKIIGLNDFEKNIKNLLWGKKTFYSQNYLTIFFSIYNFLYKPRSNSSDRINGSFNFSRWPFHLKTNSK